MFQFLVTKFFDAAQMGAFASVDKAMLITWYTNWIHHHYVVFFVQPFSA